MIRLSAINISKCRFLDKAKLKYIVRFILKHIGVHDADISVVFVNDSEIRRLNSFYRRCNRVTDVLSFSMKEGKCLFVKTVNDKRLEGYSSILGDVVISVDRARQQARIFNSTFKKEIYLYIIHGVLHLAGYRDERPLSKSKMRKKETDILGALLDRVPKKK